MEQKTVNQKIVRGFFTLTFRRAALYAINVVVLNIILARVLSPATLGVFNIAGAILAFFSYFSDIGLAGAIIQKKQVTEDDLKTTFTIQQGLGVVIAIVVWLVAPTLANIYHLDLAGMWLIRVMGVNFALTSLKVVPSVLLERELKFAPLVTVEIVETLVFNGLLVWLTFSNLGILAFTIASLARSVVGVVVINIVAPWRARVGFSKVSTKKLLSFGVPFQLNSILALLKDRLVALVVAGMVGATGVGYITWANNLAFVPLEIITIVNRITFPAFARLQDDMEALKAALEKSLFFTGLFLYPLLFGLLAIAPSLVWYVLPKWQPALPLIYLFAITTFWAALSTPFTNFLFAIGKGKISLLLMVMWTVLEWALTPVLVSKYGFIGDAYASAIIAFSSIVPILIIKRFMDVQIVKSIWQPLLAGGLMGVFTFGASLHLVTNTLSLLAMVILGGAVYIGLIAVFAKDKVMVFLKGLGNETK